MFALCTFSAGWLYGASFCPTRCHVNSKEPPEATIDNGRNRSQEIVNLEDDSSVICADRNVILTHDALKSSGKAHLQFSCFWHKPCSRSVAKRKQYELRAVGAAWKQNNSDDNRDTRPTTGTTSV